MKVTRVLLSSFVLPVTLLCLLVSADAASAETMTFETNPSYSCCSEWHYDDHGLTMSQFVFWSGDGGGHLYMQNYTDDDYIVFDSPVYLNQFEMTGRPTPGYEDSRQDIGIINISAFNSNDDLIWNTAADLTNYADDWLTINVETSDVKKLIFYAPNPGDSGQNSFWPSIDNLVVNVAPEPLSSVLFITGGTILGFKRLRKRRKTPI